jgi:hypothetical protein
MNKFTKDEKQSLIEGFFVYPIEDHQDVDEVFEVLVDWHETKEQTLLKALEYWHNSIGSPVVIEHFDYSYRKNRLQM